MDQCLLEQFGHIERMADNSLVKIYNTLESTRMRDRLQKKQMDAVRNDQG